MFVVVRGDVSPSQIAVQSCHASIEAARAIIDEKDEHPSLVLCVENSKEDLERSLLWLNAMNIRSICFHEPDLGGELTAIATEPLTFDVRKRLKNFKLLKL